ncbi:MAG TPA: hypothetical protein VFK80_00365, partial [Limnochordia bacterium]|nr:hypothetical protein [Limnochordia bacterium]
NGQSLNLVGAAWSFGVPVGVKHPYESWLLVKFLTSSEEGAKYFTLEQGRPSPVRAFNQDQRYYAQNPYWNVIGQALAQGVVPARSPLSQKIVDLDIKWYKEMLKGNQSPKGALTQLQNAVDALVKDYKSTRK